MLMKTGRQLERDTTLTMTGRLARAAAIAGALCLIGASPVIFADSSSGNMGQTAATSTRPSEYNPGVWMGRNISAVVSAFGQPTYWNATHGGGGGSRYIYDNPNQPHFVVETQAGGMIVQAAKLR